MKTILLTILILSSCNNQVQESGFSSSNMKDDDEDGYFSILTGGDDCDDSNSNIYPTSDEFCNGVDDNCNGLIDESSALDAYIWYRDADQDGYGSSETISCIIPEGFVTSNGDCDDGNTNINPSVDEIWYDGIDQNCNGESDFDSDSDDYDIDEDCDDNDSLSFPGGITEKHGLSFLCVMPGSQVMSSSFVMGSSEDEVGHLELEVQHTVTLTQPFLFGVHEVTQEIFSELMGYNHSLFTDCSQCPVDGADWHDAAAFANALSVIEGVKECYNCQFKNNEYTCELHSDYSNPYECEGYRLPTAAEWEYSARAGTTEAFNNGGNLNAGDEYNNTGSLVLDNGQLLDDIAWYKGNAEQKTHEVGTKQPNQWGIYDTHGNVYEWCHDWYSAETWIEDENPWGAISGTYRTIYGGCWGNDPINVRSAFFFRLEPDDHQQNRGFLGIRIAKSVTLANF